MFFLLIGKLHNGGNAPPNVTLSSCQNRWSSPAITIGDIRIELWIILWCSRHLDRLFHDKVPSRLDGLMAKKMGLNILSQSNQTDTGPTVSALRCYCFKVPKKVKKLFILATGCVFYNKLNNVQVFLIETRKIVRLPYLGLSSLIWKTNLWNYPHFFWEILQSLTTVLCTTVNIDI